MLYFQKKTLSIRCIRTKISMNPAMTVTMHCSSTSHLSPSKNCPPPGLRCIVKWSSFLGTGFLAAISSRFFALASLSS